MYAYDEKFILPVSHDEVVHGKKSLLDKNFGDYRMKFAGFRLFLAYMMTYPGKKLMFMGCEYAPFREWTHSDQLEWFMLGYDMHKRSQLYTAALNRFYSEHSQLWELDFSRYGFEWIYPDMRELNIIAYKRKDKSGNELIVLLNFSPVLREGFVVDGLTHGCYRAIFSSDSVEFGGSGCINTERIYKGVSQNGKISVKLDLPGMSAVILEPMNLKLQDV